MSSVAQRIAKWIWWWCLWFMRRPWMKRWQKRAFFPNGVGNRASESFIKQNRFARRNGVRIIALMLNLFMGYVVVSWVYLESVSLYSEGFFTVPQSIAQRAAR